MSGWIVPSLGYVALLGVLGVTLKFALRSLTWQELLVWTAAAYLVVGITMLAIGTPLRFHGGLPGSMAALSAFIPPVALAFFFIALDRGNASQVVPLTTAYPFITLVLAVVALSEPLAWQAVVGSALIVGGAIVLTL